MAAKRWHRNLERGALGGVILDCSNDNMKKVLSSQVFGLPRDRLVYVRNITKGLPLFLFNTDDRKLRGVYEAASEGENRFIRREWTGGQYPARVRICVTEDYPLVTLAEHQFKPIIDDNYYSEQDFQFELDHDQASKLKSLFFSLGFPLLKGYLNRLSRDLKAYKQEYILKMVLDKKVEAAQPINPPSATLAADESQVDSSWFNFHLDQSIFIVGGYDGRRCSSSLYSFSPSDDKLSPLKSMSYSRAYASVAKIDRKLYVLGGWSRSRSNSEVYHDTVESYDPRKQRWSLLPPLKTKRFRLAAAALKGKLFAIGGCHGVECLSSVEVFDLVAGWQACRHAMLERRGAVAAVEFDGAIYAVGGSDGNTCLKSAERFDPRKGSWEPIGSMETRRSSHALVVYKEKLYAIGGVVGSTLLPSVEIYDPRLDMWMDGRPMNQARVCPVAAVVMNESVYVIGGIKSDNQVSDVIECYKEGQNWKETNLTAVGKKSWFSSGIVLGEDEIDT